MLEFLFNLFDLKIPCISTQLYFHYSGIFIDKNNCINTQYNFFIIYKFIYKYLKKYF